MSDHALLSCYYNHKDIVIPQQFKVLHNTKLLNRLSLQQYFINNTHIDTIFNETAPDITANTIINEVSLMIECIAMSKKIQCKNNYVPWIDNN